MNKSRKHYIKQKITHTEEYILNDSILNEFKNTLMQSMRIEVRTAVVY